MHAIWTVLLTKFLFARFCLIVGDLHGDLDQARRALQMAGVLSSDGQDAWIGRETV